MAAVLAPSPRYGLTRTIDPRHFYPTIESAVAAFRNETGAQWTAGPPAAGQTVPGQMATDSGRRPTFPHHHPSARPTKPGCL